MTLFIPGLELNEQFYREIVGPLLTTHFPTLLHSAALIGYGSDVLGYDTELSTDHNWGPRLQLFLTPADHNARRAQIDQLLRQQLPHTFKGYAVNFRDPDANDGGTRQMAQSRSGEVHHLLELVTVSNYFQRYLGRDPYAPLTAVDWLTLGEQKLLEVTDGRVFADGLGEVEAIRATYAYYPHDIWLYRLAAQWTRIAQEEAFMGRCGAVGDELGSHIVAARLVREMMRLGFLLERSYAPYSKWFGSAFRKLHCGAQLTPLLNRVLDSHPWQARQEPLCAAYVILGEMQNTLGIAEHVEPIITDYFNRPYKVIFAGRFAEALKAAIRDEEVKALPSDLGGADQLVDSTDVTSNAAVMQKVRALYL